MHPYLCLPVCSLLENFKLEFFVFFGCRIICCCIKYVFSVNKISTLADFVNCLNLEELYIRKNEIRDLAEIRHLKKWDWQDRLFATLVKTHLVLLLFCFYWSETVNNQFCCRLPKLCKLWLADNPCAETEKYRLTVLKHLPNLQKLDNIS